MGKSFVYNTGAAQDDEPIDRIDLVYGVFIDGTLNNKDNTDLRNKYGPGSVEPTTETEIEEKRKYLEASKRSFIDRQGTDNSYSNDYTNVARMWEHTNDDYSIYVEGMGTQKSERDRQDGFAFGSGQTGVRSRVRSACELVAEKAKGEINAIDENEIGKKTINITLDVFGFSRGAAAARNFVYEVKKAEGYATARQITNMPNGRYMPEPVPYGGYPVPVQRYREAWVDVDNYEINRELLLEDNSLPAMGHLGYSLLEKTNLEFEDLEHVSIKVRFVGIYDTVSSYYEKGGVSDHYDVEGKEKDEGTVAKLASQAARQKLNKSHFKNNVADLQLNSIICEKLVHFTAKDEHRRNFALTRIIQKPGKAIEKNFPGVHCDIGGAYLTDVEVVDEIETEFLAKNLLKRMANISLPLYLETSPLNKFKKQLISEYWYKENELKINLEEISAAFIVRYLKLTGTRHVKKEYSYIFLHFMEEFARTTGMDAYFKNKLEQQYPLISTTQEPDWNRMLTERPPKRDTLEKITSLPTITVTNDFLAKVKDYLTPYVFDEDHAVKEWEFISDEALEEQRQERINKEKAKRSQEKIRKEIEEGTFLKEAQTVTQDNLRANQYRPSLIIKMYDDVTPQKQEEDKPSHLKPEKIDKIDDPYTIVLDEVEITGHNSQKMLRTLRSNYLHWSSNRDWFGMEPNDGRKREIL
ncbi:phospholipase effector Tle1 domain-containing protein [Mariniflexile ostreae]|uniref:Phospholipase effector Tle1 domain-containing protein n=1 Tax=Mariniflexile ostreae TaxID=1520892 RepID=A0ABV5FCS7_9FLAO